MLTVGLDEVGRGALCGPVVAAAAAFRPGVPRPACVIADSKTLSRRRRLESFAVIVSSPGVIWACAAASAREIDRHNILVASMLAMRRAFHRLQRESGESCDILVDGLHDPGLGARPVVGGDATVAEIAMASIVAKCVRDDLMARLGRRYPAYALASNAGYGTRQHREALTARGPSPHHRTGFRPVRVALCRHVSDTGRGEHA